MTTMKALPRRTKPQVDLSRDIFATVPLILGNGPETVDEAHACLSGLVDRTCRFPDYLAIPNGHCVRRWNGQAHGVQIACRQASEDQFRAAVRIIDVPWEASSQCGNQVVTQRDGDAVLLTEEVEIEFRCDDDGPMVPLQFLTATVSSPCGRHEAKVTGRLDKVDWKAGRATYCVSPL